MSFSKVLTMQTNMRFVVPCAGKMFYSSIEKEGQTLGLVLNKGYFEGESLADLLIFLDTLDVSLFIRVGNIDKVLKKNNTMVYRQRIYFKSLIQLLVLLKKNGIMFELSNDFKININNMLTVIDELPALEIIAAKYAEDITTYLTKVCKIHLHCLLTSLGMYSQFKTYINNLIKRKGYLDLAPFLITSYDIKKHTSSVFIPPREVILPNMYTNMELYNGEDILVGYTLDNIEKFIKARKDEKVKHESKNK